MSSSINGNYQNNSQIIESPDLHQSFMISQVPVDDYPNIVKIAGDWAKMANQKMQVVPRNLPAYRQFRSSKNIAMQTEKDLLQLMKDPNKELYVCKDLSGKVQGFVIGTKQGKRVWGHRLLTNPVNIRCDANVNEPGRAQGVGRAFFQFLAKEAPRRGIKAIFLQPTQSAVPFYLRFGFHFPARDSGNLMVKRLSPSNL